MKFKGLNDNKITVQAGISNGLIGKGRKRGSISQDNISKILCTYSDLSADWLLTGRGEMLHNEHQEQASKTTIYNRDPRDIALIESQGKQIALLEDKVRFLEYNANQFDTSDFTHVPSVSQYQDAAYTDRDKRAPK